MKQLNRICIFFPVWLVVLLATAGAYAQQVTTTATGTLITVWGDPHPELDSGGAIRHSLVMPDGTLRRLEMKGLENIATYYSGKQVTVTGRVVSDPTLSATSPSSAVLVVDKIEPSQLSVETAPTAMVVGTRKVIFLLLRFPDDVAVPHPPIFYTDMTNPETPPVGQLLPATINGFFSKTSWNQFSWQADVGGVGGVGAPGGWLTLPHPKSYYAPCTNTSCALLDQVGIDGTALGRAQGIDFKNYDNINFVMSNDLDCCAWGGSFYSQVDAKSYGATWEPPWGQQTGTYVHEMGHSLGLPHSGWVYFAYDSPWDMMSRVNVAKFEICGSYLSMNSGTQRTLLCTEPGAGYSGPYKDYLGWIPASNLVVTDTSSNTIDPALNQ